MTLTDLIDFLTDVHDLHGDLYVKVLKVDQLYEEFPPDEVYVDPTVKVLANYAGLIGKTLVIEP